MCKYIYILHICVYLDLAEELHALLLRGLRDDLRQLHERPERLEDGPEDPEANQIFVL